MIDQLADLPARAGAHRVHTGRPFVTLTYAQSLDGSIAARPGSQLHISGPETKLLTHQLRTLHAAILVGIGTVLADDPKLTARRAGGPDPQPIILDSYARCPVDAKLLEHRSRRPWIVTSQAASIERVTLLEQAGARVLRLAVASDDFLDLPAVLDWLGQEGIDSLMVEGGAQIITSFLRAQLVEQVILTIAPILVGGLRGVGDLGLGQANRFPRLRDMQVERMGDDLVVWGIPECEPA